MKKIWLIFYVIFWIVWIVMDLFLFPYLLCVISNMIALRVIWDFIIKNLIWTVISMFMVKRYEEDDVDIDLCE